MSFQTREGGWLDRQTEYPNRRTLTPVVGRINSYTIALDEGEPTVEGTEFNSANMTDLETRISNAFLNCLQIGSSESIETKPISGADNILTYLFGASAVSVALGGTGATTPEQALTNLGLLQTTFTDLASTVIPINIGNGSTDPETPTFLDSTPQIVAYRLGKTVHISCYVKFTTTDNVGTGSMALVGFPDLPFNSVEQLGGGITVHEFSMQSNGGSAVYLDVKTNLITRGSLRGVAFKNKSNNSSIVLSTETTYTIKFSGNYLTT